MSGEIKGIEGFWGELGRSAMPVAAEYKLLVYIA